MKKLSSGYASIMAFSILIAIILISEKSHGQTYQHVPQKGWDFNAGNSFSLMFGSSRQDTTSSFSVHIAGERNSFGSVFIPSLNYKRDFRLNENGVIKITLPSEIANHPDAAIGNNIVKVSISNYGTVYGTITTYNASETFLVIPENSTGKHYIVPGIASAKAGSKIGIANPNEETAKIIINPSVDAGVKKAGAAFTINLAKNQTYELNSANDLAGTQIISDKSVAVFTGSSFYYSPKSERPIYSSAEMLFPLRMQGYKYIATPLVPGKSDKLRIFASEDISTITINGDQQNPIPKGSWIDKTFETGLIIESDSRILVTQYITGLEDATLQIPPTSTSVLSYEHYHHHFPIYVPIKFALNYLSIITISEGLDSLTIDGVQVDKTLFTRIGNSDFHTARIPVKPGKHQLNCSRPVNATVSGHAKYGAYAFPAGLSVRSLDSVKNLNIAAKIYLRPGEKYCPTATVNDSVSGIKLDFKLLTIDNNFRSLFQFTSNGKAVVDSPYCYTQNTSGNDTVIVNAGNLYDTAVVHWANQFPELDRYYHDIRYPINSLRGWVANEDGGGPNPPNFSSPTTRYIINYPLIIISTDLNMAGILELRHKTFAQKSNVYLGGITGPGYFTRLYFIGSPGSLNLFNVYLSGSPALDTSIVNVEHEVGRLELRDRGYKTVVKTESITTFSNIIIGRNQTLVSKGDLSLGRLHRVDEGGKLIGEVTISRSISSIPNRKWVFVSAPILGNKSIFDTWQGKRQRPNGIGVVITGGSAANGFDTNIPGADYSMKYYNSETQHLDNVLNTYNTPVGMRPYFVFSRRSTTLKAKGEVFIGSKIMPVQKNGFTALVNPYPCPINFSSLGRNEVARGFYFWNSRIGGANGVGGYVVATLNQYGAYEYVPDFPSIGRNSIAIISSGESFLVKAIPNAVNPTLAFSEFSKITTYNEIPPRLQANPGISMVAPDKSQSFNIRVNLLDAETSSSEELSPLIDGMMISYDSRHSNALDDMDFEKPENFQENLAIGKHNKKLMLERKNHFTHTDTTSINLWNMQKRTYRLSIVPENLTNKNISIRLQDRFLKNFRELSSEDITEISFSITDDPHSYAIDRFSIILSKTRIIENETSNNIVVYPNPLSGNEFSIQMYSLPKGVYELQMVNALGQLVHRQRIEHPGGNVDQQIILNRKPAKGLFNIKILGEGFESTVKIIKP